MAKLEILVVKEFVPVFSLDFSERAGLVGPRGRKLGGFQLPTAMFERLVNTLKRTLNA